MNLSHTAILQQYETYDGQETAHKIKTLKERRNGGKQVYERNEEKKKGELPETMKI